MVALNTKGMVERHMMATAGQDIKGMVVLLMMVTVARHIKAMVARAMKATVVLAIQDMAVAKIAQIFVSELRLANSHSNKNK